MITSPANPTIKQIRKLRERKERQQSGSFYLEGLHIVGEAVTLSWPLETLIYAPERMTSIFGRQTVDAFIAKGGSVLEVSGAVFDSLSEKDGPQGLAAVAKQRWSALDSIAPAGGDLWIALDSVADPGNLGTIMRTCDAVGGKGVMLLDQSTDPYDPSAVRGSMGALFACQLVRCNFPEFSAWKRAVNIPVIGTSDKAAQDYHSYPYPDPFVLLMGSERQGLQEMHLNLCDAVVAIPMLGRSDSLNLAVATALVAYEAYNHHRDQR
jgi:TrmH family RNA methyltransferase